MTQGRNHVGHERAHLSLLLQAHRRHGDSLIQPPLRVLPPKKRIDQLAVPLLILELRLCLQKPERIKSHVKDHRKNGMDDTQVTRFCSSVGLVVSMARLPVISSSKTTP